MTTDLETVGSELGRDLSPQWLELSSRVRKLALEAQAQSPDSAFASEAIRLCEHVERLHTDVEQLLGTLKTAEVKIQDAEAPKVLPTAPPEAIDEENIQIQREMHQKSDLQHIIKALFMWKDDPEERVRARTDG